MEIKNSITISINEATKNYYEWSDGHCECKTIFFDSDSEIINTTLEIFKDIDEMKKDIINSLEFNLEWNLK